MTLPASFLSKPLTHRALHDNKCAENSVHAIEAAIAHGYGIELDIQQSRDGVPMVFHDYSLERLTGETGPIAQRTSRELSDIKLLGGGGFIPTFEQVLELVAGRVPLLVEIKDQDGALGPNIGPLEKAICNALHGYNGDIALMSFNPNAVAACAEYAPDVPRGLTTCAYPAKDWPTVPAKVREFQATIPDFERIGACFISHQHQDLKSPHVAHLKARGVPILCWTIRSPSVEMEARKIADNITFEGYHA